MSSQITLTLLQESLSGDIGSDWKYQLKADLIDPLVFGSGLIEVSEHLLRPGATQAPPESTHPITLAAGDCGAETRLRLTLEATEVDWLIDDNASNVSMITVRCPAPGAEPTVAEHEVAARVREAPGFQGGLAVLKLKVRVVAECVGG